MIRTPTLSLIGFVNSPETALYILYKRFLSTEKHSSYFFSNEITSFKYIVSEGKDNRTLLDKLESSLTEYLNRHYTSSSVTVDIVTTEKGLTYEFDITVDDDGKEIILHDTVEALDVNKSSLIEKLKGIKE